MIPRTTSVSTTYPVTLAIPIQASILAIPLIVGNRRDGCNTVRVLCSEGKHPMVLASYLHICGDFWCDKNGHLAGIAPPLIRGLSEDSNFELSLGVGGLVPSPDK